jgi:hypothetical protein
MEEEERIRQAKPQYSTPWNCKKDLALGRVLGRLSSHLQCHRIRIVKKPCFR